MTPHESFLECSQTGVVRVRLRVTIEGCRALVLPPMVKNAGNVHYAGVMVGQSQNEIVVLGAVVSGPKPTNCFCSLSIHHEQVAKIHAGQEQRRRPGGLEDGQLSIPMLIHIILVRI